VSTEAKRAADERYPATEGSTATIFFDVMVALLRHRAAPIDMNNISSFGTLFADV
jgi:hypothetical protein